MGVSVLVEGLDVIFRDIIFTCLAEFRQKDKILRDGFFLIYKTII